ncbi:putative transporter SVOPL [Choristoneura fumiferana]|uniref:putative transporter SVOPL n=1 Tax=Choristoneura fumiferana TaxID=7141 RepID=UPI003D15C609
MVANGITERKRSMDKVPASATLDEAMLATGLGLYNILHMLLSGLILMGVIMQTLSLGYVIPAAQCDLNVGLENKGWLAALPFTAMILTSHMWGFLADTRGRRPVMMLSMLFSVILSILASFAPNLPVFAVLQFLSAVFMSGPSAVVYTYLGEFNNLHHRDKMVAFGASFVGIGTVLLPGVSWLILPLDFAWPIPWLGIDYRPWRFLVIACAIPYAIGTILMFFAPESPKFHYAKGRTEECLETLKKIYAANKWTTPDHFPVKSLILDPQAVMSSDRKGIGAVLSSMWDQTAPLFRKPLLKWTALTCFVQFGIFATCNGFYVWFPTILNSLANHDGVESRICDILDAGARSASNATEVVCDDTMNTETFERSIYIGLVFCSMYIVVGFLVDLVGKKAILIVILGGSGLCGIGAHLAGSQQTAVVLFAVFQMSGACIGMMNAVAVELFPTRIRAMAVCLSMMMGRLGSVVGSNLIGVFMRTNCGVSFYLFGGLLLVCCCICLTLPGKRKMSKQTTKSVEPTQNETHEPV